MNQLIKAYNSCPLLHALPLNLVESYYRNGNFQIKTYGKHKILHLEGERCTSLEVIIEGFIVVERIDESGNLLTVTSFDSGNIIGANLLYSSHPFFPMTVTSKLPSTTLIINESLALELCNSYPKFLIEFLKVISDHTVILGTKIKHHVSRTIKEGIITFIRREYLLQNSYTIHLNLSKKALAEQMGVSRTSLSRELQKMKFEGLIDFDRKTITILDTSLLNESG